MLASIFILYRTRDEEVKFLALGGSWSGYANLECPGFLIGSETEPDLRVFFSRSRMDAKKVQERCQYFIERKSRTCRMLVKTGHKYCGEHAGQERNRIPCPLDPKHTVAQEELQTHLAKCNSRLNTDLPYVQRDINGIAVDEPMDHDRDAFSLTQLTSEELTAAMEKVESIFVRLDIRVDENTLDHGSMKGALESDSYGTNAKRHLRQQSSILGHADQLGLLAIGTTESVCYIEFGAGRAKLSYWLAKAVEETLGKGTYGLDLGFGMWDAGYFKGPGPDPGEPHKAKGGHVIQDPRCSPSHGSYLIPRSRSGIVASSIIPSGRTVWSTLQIRE